MVGIRLRVNSACRGLMGLHNFFVSSLWNLLTHPFLRLIIHRVFFLNLGVWGVVLV